jgi:hypothetical protein
MFSDEEFNQYQKDFEKLNVELSNEEQKQVLEFAYSLGVITYEFINSSIN